MNRSWNYRIEIAAARTRRRELEDGIKALEAKHPKARTPARLCATVSPKTHCGASAFGFRDFEPEQPKLPRSSSATVRGAAI
jgi:hypothetical protein